MAGAGRPRARRYGRFKPRVKCALEHRDTTPRTDRISCIECANDNPQEGLLLDRERHVVHDDLLELAVLVSRVAKHASDILTRDGTGALRGLGRELDHRSFGI